MFHRAEIDPVFFIFRKVEVSCDDRGVGVVVWDVCGHLFGEGSPDIVRRCASGGKRR